MSESTAKHVIDVTPTPLAAPCDAPAGGLSPLERVAVESFVRASRVSLDALVAQIDVWAGALRGSRRDDARLQLLSQAIAASRAKTLMIEALRNDHLASGCVEGVMLMERLLAGEHRRLLGLLAEHRLSSVTGTRSVNVSVGVAQNVAVLAPGGG